MSGSPAEGAAASVSRLATTVLLLAVGLVAAGVLLPQQHAGPSYRPMAGPAAPVRLVVPSVHIRARVVPLALTGAVLEPPGDPRQVGWWDRSARPGSGTGQTVITGHTVHTGGGAMDRIGKVRPGSYVDVVTRRGTMRYRVDRVAVLSKERLARRAPAIFGQRHGDGRLVLVTCIGWNGSYYPDNVLVFGQPLGEPAHAGREVQAGGAMHRR